MKKLVLRLSTLCLMLMLTTMGRAAIVNAIWDFSDEFSSFETIQGTTGTFTNNGIEITVDATNGKFRANGNSAQMNEGTRILVPVVSTNDEVSFVAYAANYSHFTIGNEDCDGEASYSHKATAAEVKEGYVVIASTNNNSYIKSVAVRQVVPDDVLEEDLTAMWDFQNANPASLPDVHIERNTGTVPSTVEGVSMFVDATNGKLKGRASDAQFNANTILQIPVKSNKDIVEVTTYPNYGAGRIAVGNDEATGDVVTHKATTAEVSQGYVEVKALQECYLYRVQVTFVSPLQEKELYATDFTDWPTIDRKKATNQKVEVTTKYSHENLTFTLNGVGADPAGVQAKFPDYTGYMISAKYTGEYSAAEPSVVTSPLASITKIEFTQCATGGNRGWVIAVKGDGDEDWVPIFNQSITNASGETHTLDINRKNAQLKFYNFNLAQNSYMMDLKIYGKVDLGKAPALASFTANGVTYQAADIFNEDENGNMVATIEISKSEPMVNANNPLTDIIPENGEIGNVEYAPSPSNPEESVITIPVELNGETATYFVNAVWKPDFTVTYFYGSDEIGTSVIEKDAPIGTFAFTENDLTIPEGMKFRGWCFSEDGGQKATEATTITGNLSLYALVTDIEGDDNTERNTYDFRNRYFYPEDHEALSIEGQYSYNGGTHGYDVKPTTSLKVYVAGNAIITISNCEYSRGEINLLAPDGSLVGTFVQPASGADGAVSAVKYEGEAGWLTLEMTAQAYIHYLNVINTGDAGTIEPVNGYYIAKAGDANSLLNIFDALLLNNNNGRVKVFLPDGTYDLGKKALTAIPYSNVSIIGQSMDKTIITNAPNVKNEGIGTTATLFINSKIENTYFQDLTLKNGLDYYAAGAAGRAVCLQDKGNHTIAKNVAILSHQDSYYSNNNDMQAYWETSRLNGTVDFICGGGDIRFSECTLGLEPRNANGTGERTITAPTTTTPFGYVFDNCKVQDLTNGKGSWNYGRTWQNSPICVYLYTVLDDNAAATIVNSRWTQKGMNNTDIKLFGEYKTMSEDMTVISPASNIVASYGGNYETILTDEQAAFYSYENMFSENQEKPWNPRELCEQIDAPAFSYANGLLTWEPQRGATAYAIFKNDVFVAIVGPNDTSFNLDADAADVITIRSANEMGGFGPAADLILTLDENEENEIPESGTFVNTLNVKRTFAGNTWNTICLPVDIEESWTADEANPFYGASIMELANASYDEASMTQNFNFLPVSKAVAGKPYVIKFNNDVENPVLKYVTIKAEAPETIEAGNCTMTGLFNPYEFTESDKSVFFLISGNRFSFMNEPGTIKGLRAFFTLNGIEPDMYSKILFNFGEVDGIRTVNMSELGDEMIYDLQGRKLNNSPQKGVYIKNGHKYVK